MTPTEWWKKVPEGERPSFGYRKVWLCVSHSLVGVLLFFPVARAASADWVRFEGVEDAALLGELRAASSLARMADAEGFTDTWLLRKADNDCAALLDALRAAGYHDSTVRPEVGTDKEGRFVRFVVETGDRYAFDSPALTYESPVAQAVADGMLKKLSVKSGAPAQAQDVVGSEKTILSQLRDAGHPFARIADRKVIVDHIAHSVHVEYDVAPGDACRFGSVTCEGLEHVSESVVLAELPWKQGDAYTQKLVDKAKKRLLKTNLFSMVTLEPQPCATPAEACVRVHVIERKPRSIALGIQYRTEEGPGAHALWEHRNLDGVGHRLALVGDLSAIQQGLSAKYELPRFMTPDQTLSLGLKASHDTPDAYDSRAVDTTVWLERRFGETFNAGAGLSVRYSHVKQQKSVDDFLLLSVPFQTVWDMRNDLVNPTSGVRLLLREEPYVDLAGSGSAFLKSDWTVTAMHPLGDDDDWVLAGRLRLSTITGDGLRGIPADIRLYAGGGGSIRGFGYQKAGALDKEKDPVGGRSLAEWTLEMRKKITEHIGIAAFVDGGASFSTEVPDFSWAIFWGGGIGVRYFTPIGPIRFDIAAPLNPRNHIDAAVQFYVSVGQAF
jgi:translocation and assembly module TamA